MSAFVFSHDLPSKINFFLRMEGIIPIWTASPVVRVSANGAMSSDKQTRSAGR